ncbi:hypothetical protein BDP55DRAFT_682581 [Colletotrichum godetiae]|uniref:Uncharacterized protein n=1 Tax=Colletotrichum godetiae TaxID=1209918 RepID=A0AAJ0A8N7_9PEZI|nr:uncharacterized protein BDP55DRAFT_682581 [Colletotrichum godetiae]KAK1658558.1 hypothetical protein BDP55DRAFT_682581 [Colletotrichum godetiae]
MSAILSELTPSQTPSHSIYLPPEILAMTLRTLALYSKLFRITCTPLLYQRDFQSPVPRCVAWAISECEDDSVSLCVLQRTQQVGADFERRLPYDCFLGHCGTDVFESRRDCLFRGTELLSAFKLALLLGRDKLVAFLLQNGFHDQEVTIDNKVWSLLPFKATHASLWELDTSIAQLFASDGRFQPAFEPFIQYNEFEPTFARLGTLSFAPWFPMSQEEILQYVYECGVSSFNMGPEFEFKRRRMFVVKAKSFRPRCNLW